MKVGVVAWVGSDNLGDELLLHALIGCVRSVREDASFLVFAPDPDRVTSLHSVPAVPMPTLRARGAAGRQGAAQRAIRGCDLLVFGPGTVFQERSPNLPWPGTLVLFARLLGMARLAGTPVAPIGVGVREGGTVAGRQLLRLMGAASLAVGTRDCRSAGYFGRKAQVIGDLAYTLILPEPVPPATGRRLAVSLRPLPGSALGDIVSRCVDRLRAGGWTASFMPMAYGRGARGEDDRDLYDGSMNLLPNPLDADAPLADALDGWVRTLRAHQLVLATRLHAALVAVALGVPTVAIGYERKVLDAFADLGLGQFAVPSDVDSETLYRTAVAAVSAPEAFRAASARAASQGKVARQFVASVLDRVG